MEEIPPAVPTTPAASSGTTAWRLSWGKVLWWSGSFLFVGLLWWLNWRWVFPNPDDLRFASDFGSHPVGQTDFREIPAGFVDDYFDRNGRTADVLNRVVMAGWGFWPVTMAAMSALETLALAFIVKAFPAVRRLPAPVLILFSFTALSSLNLVNKEQIGSFVFWPAAHVTYLWELVLLALPLASLLRFGGQVSRWRCLLDLFLIVVCALHLETFGTAMLVVSIVFLVGSFFSRCGFPVSARAYAVAAFIGGGLSLVGPGHWRRLSKAVAVDEPFLRHFLGQTANAVAQYAVSLPLLAGVIAVLVAVLVLWKNRESAGAITVSPGLHPLLVIGVAFGVLAGDALLILQAKLRVKAIGEYCASHELSFNVLLTSKVAGMTPTLLFLGTVAVTIVLLAVLLFLTRRAIGMAPLWIMCFGLAGCMLPVLAGQVVARTFSSFTLSALLVCLVLLVQILGLAGFVRWGKVTLSGAVIVIGVAACFATNVLLVEHNQRYAPTFEAVYRNASMIDYPRERRSNLGYWNPFVDHQDVLIRPAFDLPPESVFRAQ